MSLSIDLEEHFISISHNTHIVDNFQVDGLNYLRTNLFLAKSNSPIIFT